MAHDIRKIFSDGYAPLSAFGTKRRSIPSNYKAESEIEMNKFAQVLSKMEEFTKELNKLNSMLLESINEQKLIRGDIAFILKQLSSKKDKTDK